MKTIIKKAIEGGWVAKMCVDPEVNFHWYRHEIVLDPTFWQALGKACNWRSYWTFRPLKNIEEDRANGKVTPGNWVEHHALKFHEINLTEDWDKAVLYLQEIIK